MFKVTYNKTFVRHFRSLPSATQKKVDTFVGLLAIDFRDSRLHTKKLKTVSELYSFRAGREYRVLFSFVDGSTIMLLAVKHRKDIYKNL